MIHSSLVSFSLLSLLGNHSSEAPRSPHPLPLQHFPQSFGSCWLPWFPLLFFFIPVPQIPIFTPYKASLWLFITSIHHSQCSLEITPPGQPLRGEGTCLPYHQHRPHQVAMRRAVTRPRAVPVKAPVPAWPCSQETVGPHSPRTTLRCVFLPPLPLPVPSPPSPRQVRLERCGPSQPALPDRWSLLGLRGEQVPRRRAVSNKRWHTGHPCPRPVS